MTHPGRPPGADLHAHPDLRRGEIRLFVIVPAEVLAPGGGRGRIVPPRVVELGVVPLAVLEPGNAVHVDWLSVRLDHPELWGSSWS